MSDPQTELFYEAQITILRLQRELAEARGFKALWERDSTALGRVLNDLSMARAVAEDRRAQAARAERELAEVLDALPKDARYLDPPDGGDVPVAEQVRRMASALAETREALDIATAGLTVVERRRDDLKAQLAVARGLLEGMRKELKRDPRHSYSTQWMRHDDGCEGGDQECKCGMAQARWNLESCVESSDLVCARISAFLTAKESE